MKWVTEVGAGERDREREAEARSVQLVDRDDDEGPWLRLLGSTCRIGIRPVDLSLLGSGYHSGVGASNADSIARLSAW